MILDEKKILNIMYNDNMDYSDIKAVNIVLQEKINRLSMLYTSLEDDCITQYDLGDVINLLEYIKGEIENGLL